jgi:hypothetical protein
MQPCFSETTVDCWLTHYKATYHHLLNSDPEFARWLNEEYVPIAGSWQY